MHYQTLQQNNHSEEKLKAQGAEQMSLENSESLRD